MCKNHTFMKNNHAQHAYLLIFMYLANGFIQCIQVMLSPGIEPLTLVVLVQRSTSWATGTNTGFLVTKLYLLDNSNAWNRKFTWNRCGLIQPWAFTMTVCTQIQPPHTQVHIRNPFVSIWNPLMSAVAGLPLLWLQWAHSRALVIQQNVCGADPIKSCSSSMGMNLEGRF